MTGTASLAPANARSLPSARISTIRPSAFSLTRIMVTPGLCDSRRTAKDLAATRIWSRLVRRPQRVVLRRRGGCLLGQELIDRLARAGPREQKALHFVAAG